MSILIALVPAIMWGSIGLVSGRLGGSASQQTLGMTMGAGTNAIKILIFNSLLYIYLKIYVSLSKTKYHFTSYESEFQLLFCKCKMVYTLFHVK